MSDLEKKYVNKWHIAIGILFIIIILVNSIPMLILGEEYFSKYNIIGKEQQNSIISFDTAVESSLLTTGMGVISLAIAVWTGLNIVNAISRKEVDILKTKTEDIQNKFEELGVIYSNIREINKNEFLEKLLKTDSDLMSRYFYKKFKDITCSPDIFYQLTLIEQLFAQIYHMHTNENANDSYVQDITQEMKREIEKTLIYIEKAEQSKKENLKDIKNYLNFRKAEGLFYRGYTLDVKNDRDEICEVYEQAIEEYLNLAKEFITNFSSLTSEDTSGEILCKEYELFSYYTNTIGEAYSKIIQNCPKHKDIDKMAKKAEKYCKLAIQCAENHNCSKEIYYRNLGCAYERIENAKKTKFLYSKEIIYNYYKAFKLTINQTQISKEHMRKVYHTYLSYLNKYISSKIVTQELENNISKAIDDPKNNCKILRKKIISMYRVATIAIKDDIRIKLNVIMYGFSNGYVILLKQVDKKKSINNILNGDIEFYLRNMRWAIDTLEVMNINDTYTKQLKNFYKGLMINIAKTNNI